MKLFTLLFFFITLKSVSFSQDGTWDLLENMYDWPAPYFSTMEYVAIDCADRQNCIAFGNFWFTHPWNRVTTDGGKSWVTTLGYTDTTYSRALACDVAYPDTSLCLALCDSGYYWRSTDKCRTWERKKLANESYDYPLVSHSFYDKNNGVIATVKEIFMTSDAGITWANINNTIPDSIFPSFGFYHFQYLDKNTLIILCVDKSINRFIIRTDDGCKTWKTFPLLGDSFDDIKFINSKEGWAVNEPKFKPGSRKEIILHTTDGGETWQTQLDTAISPYGGLYKIHFSDSLNGAAMGRFNTLWRTTNSGKLWTKDNKIDKSIKRGWISDFYIFAQDDIIALSDADGYIYWYHKPTSAEDFQTWPEENLPGTVIFPNPSKDYVVINNMGEKAEFFNSLGLPVLEARAFGRIDISSLPAGVYFVRTGGSVYKLVKAE